MCETGADAQQPTLRSTQAQLRQPPQQPATANSRRLTSSCRLQELPWPRRHRAARAIHRCRGAQWIRQECRGALQLQLQLPAAQHTAAAQHSAAVALPAGRGDCVCARRQQPHAARRQPGGAAQPAAQGGGRQVGRGERVLLGGAAAPAAAATLGGEHAHASAQGYAICCHCCCLLQVVLHMELLPAGGSLCSDVAAAAPSDAAGSADTAAAPAGGAQRLSVKRVLRGDAARTFLRRPGRDEWAAVSQVCMGRAAHVRCRRQPWRAHARACICVARAWHRRPHA